MNLWLELDSWPLSLSWLERCTGITGPQVRFLPGTLSCIFRSCSWLGLINLYKFLLDIFHPQYPSTIIQSGEMPAKSGYLIYVGLYMTVLRC